MGERKNMKIELIMTGDELLDGRVLNSNSRDIGKALSEEGFKISRITTVGDNPNELEKVFQYCSKNSDIAIITGGLGPTEDDRTSEILAKVANVPFEQDKKAFKRLQRFFQERHRPMATSNIKQSYFPIGAKIIKNHKGTADGFELVVDHCHFFVMPGVPREMNVMMQDDVLPAIIKLFGKRHKKPQKQIFRTFGQGESHIADLLGEIYPLPKNVEIGYRVHYPEVDVSLQVYQQNTDELFEELKNEISTRLKNYIFSFEQKSFVETITTLLKQHHKTLSLAESCTGGLIAHYLTEQSGASEYFLASAVTYSNEAKSKILKIPQALIEKYGAVSPNVAQAMSEGIQKITDSDLSIAVTGIAGPNGGTTEKPVGTVYISISTKDNTKTHLFHFAGDRRRIQIYTAYSALHLLKHEILLPNTQRKNKMRYEQ